MVGVRRQQGIGVVDWDELLVAVQMLEDVVRESEVSDGRRLESGVCQHRLAH